MKLTGILQKDQQTVYTNDSPGHGSIKVKFEKPIDRPAGEVIELVLTEDGRYGVIEAIPFKNPADNPA